MGWQSGSFQQSAQASFGTQFDGPSNLVSCTVIFPLLTGGKLALGDSLVTNSLSRGLKAITFP